MKRKYQKPEIEAIEIYSEHILTASLEWSPDSNNSLKVIEEESDELEDGDLG